jgi:hypothetical protein
VTVVEQDLRKQAAHRVAHDDRRALQLAYDALQVLDDGGNRQRLDRGGILAQRLYLDFQTGVGWGEHAVAAALVALDPLLPAARGHPEAVDQDDGVRSGLVGGVLCGHGVLLRKVALYSIPSVHEERGHAHPPTELVSRILLTNFGELLFHAFG